MLKLALQHLNYKRLWEERMRKLILFLGVLMAGVPTIAAASSANGI